jgi:hypothetical protein
MQSGASSYGHTTAQAPSYGGYSAPPQQVQPPQYQQQPQPPMASNPYSAGNTSYGNYAANNAGKAVIRDDSSTQVVPISGINPYSNK